MPRSIQVGVPSGWFVVTTLTGAPPGPPTSRPRPPCSSPLLGRWSLNPDCPAVDQTTMRMPEVSHPSPTTAEDFRRVLDERAIQPLFQPLIDRESRTVLSSEARAT